MNNNGLNFFKGLFNAFVATLLLFLICFGCFMAGYNFRKPSNDLSFSLSPADSVVSDYTFSTNSFTLPLSYADGEFNNQTQNFLSWGFINISFVISNSSSDNSVNLSINYSFYKVQNSEANDFNNSRSLTVGVDDWYDNYFYIDRLHFWGVVFPVRVQSGFVANLSSITLHFLPGVLGYLNSPVFEFVDVNGKKLEVQIPFNSNDATIDIYRLYFTPVRTIFISQDLTSNDIYNSGYDYGYQQGLISSQQSVYDRGYNTGYSIGDSAGYARGVNAANTYTFFNLFGAMFDVPVQTVTGLLNFDFLGFNLFNLATGILTFVIMLKIIRFILGGK